MGPQKGSAKSEETQSFIWYRANMPSTIRKESSLKTLNIAPLKNGFYCFGRVGGGIMTVRFTYRKKVIRIIGAGFWRKGRKIYEKRKLSIQMDLSEKLKL